MQTNSTPHSALTDEQIETLDRQILDLLEEIIAGKHKVDDDFREAFVEPENRKNVFVGKHDEKGNYTEYKYGDVTITHTEKYFDDIEPSEGELALTVWGYFPYTSFGVDYTKWFDGEDGCMDPAPFSDMRFDDTLHCIDITGKDFNLSFNYKAVVTEVSKWAIVRKYDESESDIVRLAKRWWITDSWYALVNEDRSWGYEAAVEWVQRVLGTIAKEAHPRNLYSEIHFREDDMLRSEPIPIYF